MVDFDFDFGVTYNAHEKNKNQANFFVLYSNIQNRNTLSFVFTHNYTWCMKSCLNNSHILSALKLVHPRNWLPLFPNICRLKQNFNILYVEISLWKFFCYIAVTHILWKWVKHLKLEQKSFVLEYPAYYTILGFRDQWNIRHSKFSFM